MITPICPKEQCTGCAACYNICPQECIQMLSDQEGFLYPDITMDRCNDCGACKNICPILQARAPNPSATPLVYACWNNDETVRFQSASGGTFTALAKHVLNAGGVVFGAAFDEDMHVKHIAVRNENELVKLRSSKYVQSSIGQTYAEALNLLRENLQVLFSGTPCQIAGLNAFIGNKDDNLFTCDMLCHGVPSPGLFARYVAYLEKRYKSRVRSINFRHKRIGWNLASTVALFDDGRQRVLDGVADSFMHGFINSLSLRSACHRCPYTSIDRGGDITLADFWGIGEFAPFHHPTQSGISLILVNSEKGRWLFEQSTRELCTVERTLEEALYKREKLKRPLPEPTIRKHLFSDYMHITYEELAKIYLVDKGLKRFIKHVVPRRWLFNLRKYLKMD